MIRQKIRVAFNGFGRIGRHVFRLLWGHPSVEIVGIWVPYEKAAERALYVSFDPHYGHWDGHSVSYRGARLIVDGQEILLQSSRPKSPCSDSLDAFRDHAWDILIECSGTLKEDPMPSWEKFRDFVGSRQKVIFTYPTALADATIVMGVNHTIYDRSHRMISNASCTTNCAAPILKTFLQEGLPLAECAGITVHAATGRQEALAILGQIMDYTTGAAKILDAVLPELRGRMHMTAVRVPTAEVSYLQLMCLFEKHVSVDDIRSLLSKGAEGSMNGIIGLSPVETPKTDVSGFYRKNSHSAIVNLRGISGAKEGNIRIVPAWYDNEYAYSCRVRDLLFYIAEREKWVVPTTDEHIDEYIPRPEKQYYE